VKLHSSATGDEGFTAVHVASCLLMFKDSFSSRIKHAHIDKYICKGVMHDCTLPSSQSVVEMCSLVIEILVVVQHDTGNAAFYHTTAHAVQMPFPLLPFTTSQHKYAHNT